MNASPRSASRPVILVGEKACGKSSLIARICGIHLGTSTTCPIEWSFRYSATWAAQVSVAYRYSGLFSGTFTVGARTILNPEALCSTPEELWLLLRKAEILALSPKQDYVSILSMNEDSINNKYFTSILTSSSPSTGVIYVDFQFPDVAPRSMTVIDLPGLSSSGYVHRIEYTKLLIKYYVIRRGAIVAVVGRAAGTEARGPAKSLPFPGNVFAGLDLDVTSTSVIFSCMRSEAAIDPRWLTALKRETASEPHLFLIPEHRPPFATDDIQDLRQNEAAFFQFSQRWSKSPEMRSSLGAFNIMRSWREISRIHKQPKADAGGKLWWFLLALFTLVTYLAIVIN